MPKERKDLMYRHLSLAYVSAESIVKNGYELVMYTDKLGKEVLDGFPYDEVIVEKRLDETNKKMFASPKYFALGNEPLGTIHLDYDIIIEKPCLEPKEEWDIVTQMVYKLPTKYKKERAFMSKNGYPKGMQGIKISDYPYCTGVIGFNNAEMKALFLDNYFDAVKIYKDRDIPKDICIDFLLEQSYASTLVEHYGFTPAFVVKDGDFFKYVSNGSRYYEDKETGFVHYQGASKWSDEVQQMINKRLTPDAVRVINRNFLKIS